jgi:branched-chain amino acid aminotransferase
LDSKKIVWSNGEFLDMDLVPLFPYFRGLQFGDGLFETIRADAGTIFYLKEHLQRLAESASAFNIKFPKDENWESNIQQLLALNELDRQTARIKIILTRGPEISLGLPTTEKSSCLITADQYLPPDSDVIAKGLNLVTYSSDCPNNLSEHKTLNYLFYLVARQYAVSIGYHEAIITDRDGRISETSTGSLLFHDGQCWLSPDSWYQLPGITISQVEKLLRDEKLNFQRKALHSYDLADMTKAFVLNSLSGLIPVARIGEIIFKNIDAQFADKINKQLF